MTNVEPTNTDTTTQSTTVDNRKTAIITQQESTISANWQQIQVDVSDMIRYASKRGIAIPTTVTLDDTTDQTHLLANYNTMVTAIQPATVQSVHYINHHILGSDDEDKKWYATPVMSKCLFIAGLALISMILTSLSPVVNSDNQKAGLLNSEGMTLLTNLTFICSASLLGVMFFLLKTISDKIKNYTLLPVDSIEVNATIIIGVISGFIIAELFDFNKEFMAGSVEAQKMTLALLGGFSSDAIFSVLKGVVNKAKALFATPSDG